MRPQAILLLCGLLLTTEAVSSGSSTETKKAKAAAKKLRKSTRKLQTDGVIQVDEYDCSSQEESFSTTVLIDFHEDVSMIGDDVIKQMEAGFVESYRELVFALCDVPYFRNVVDAEIEALAHTDDSMNFEFENDDCFKETNRTHFLKVHVSAKCRECKEDIIFSAIGDQSENAENLNLVLPAVQSRGGGDYGKNNEKESHDCICPSRESFPPQLRSPTEAEFHAVFSNVVAGLASDDIPDKFELFEAEEVECSSNSYYNYDGKTKSMHSTVFVRFDGDLSSLDDDDIVVLEESFLATYNGLNFAYCDYPYFRTITNITLDQTYLEEGRGGGRRKRKLQGAAVSEDAPVSGDSSTGEDDGDEDEETSGDDGEAAGKEDNIELDFSENALLIDPPFDANILRFEVTLECKGDCGAGTPLFSFVNHHKDSSSGKDSHESYDEDKSVSEDQSGHDTPTIAEIIETLPPTDVLLGRSNTMQGDSGYCYCPAHPESPGRAPTADEFQAAYSVVLTKLKEEESKLDHVATLEDVLEVSAVECEILAKDFTSTVFVELDKPLEKLSELQKFTIADSFLQSYNALSFSTCDKVFRELSEVTLVTTSSRRRDRKLQGDLNVTQITDDRFPAVFNVLGRCRDCEVDDSGAFMLFEDTFDESTRRLLGSEVDRSSSIIFGSSVAPPFAGPSRWLKEYEDTKLHVCSCPADVHPKSTSPTDEAFIEIFNCRMKELDEAGMDTGFGKVLDLVEASELCHGGTFYSFMGRYKLGFSGDVDSCSDDLLEEAFRLTYNAMRQEDCDPLVSAATLIQRDSTLEDTDFAFVRLMVDTIQLEMGDLFGGNGVLDLLVMQRFVENYNAFLRSHGGASASIEEECTAILVTSMLDPSEAPSGAPTETPSYEPTAEPTHDPTKDPSREPSWEPSRDPSSSPSREPSRSPSYAPPSIPPSIEPSVYPTNHRAMCNYKVTELNDHVIIDYRITRIADIELPFGIKLADSWPLEEPATLIVAEEYLAAYNRLQQKVFCDPFDRRMAEVTCVSTENKVLSGTVCCTVNFKCRGNCEKFIYPDKDPIGSFYDQPGFEYPTDDSCVCNKENAPERAPSASEHFDKINDSVPLEILSFEFKGFATDGCPK